MRAAFRRNFACPEGRETQAKVNAMLRQGLPVDRRGKKKVTAALDLSPQRSRLRRHWQSAVPSANPARGRWPSQEHSEPEPTANKVIGTKSSQPGQPYGRPTNREKEVDS